MKSPLKSLATLILMFDGGRASALNIFECVNGLMPLTVAASAKAKRSGVEKPFVADEKYLVFPEVARGRLTGFFVYLAEQSWYFDTIEEIAPTRGRTPLSALQGRKDLIYRMIAQPNGLETLTLEYMPGLLADRESRSASEVLGASVLPGVGALVSRPRPQAQVYNSRESRGPASVADVEVPTRIVRLVTRVPKAEGALRAPLIAEHKLRKAWIQNHNLNQESFRQLTALMQGDCHE